MVYIVIKIFALTRISTNFSKHSSARIRYIRQGSSYKCGYSLFLLSRAHMRESVILSFLFYRTAIVHNNRTQV